MQWLVELWTNKPEAVFAGGVAISVAVGGAWATLRAARKKSEVPLAIQNTQTGQIGGQGVQAHTVHGGIRHQEGIGAEELAHIVAKLTSEHKDELHHRDDQLQQKEEEFAQLKAAYDELSREAERADDPNPFEAALSELREGRPGAAEELFRKIVDKRRAAGKDAFGDAARAARHIGAIAFYHDTQKALEAYQQAVALDSDNAEGWNQLGLLQMRLGEPKSAIDSFEKVLSLGNNLIDKMTVATASGNLGNVYVEMRDLKKAEEATRESLALYESMSKQDGMARTYISLGNIYLAGGNYSLAQENYEKALQICQTLNHLLGIGNSYGALGNLFFLRRDFPAAQDTYQKALELFQGIGYLEGVAGILGSLGNLFDRLGETGLAEQYFRQTLEIERSLNRKFGIANALGSIGIILMQRNDLAGAEKKFDKALSLHLEAHNLDGVANSRRNLGLIYIENGDLAAGCASLQEAKNIYEGFPSNIMADKIAEIMREYGCPNK